MKKFSVPFILVQAAILLVISLIAGVAVGLYSGGEHIGNVIIFVGLLVFVCLIIIYIVGAANFFTNRLAEKTMEKGTAEQNFQGYSTFYSSAVGICATIIRIEERTGRIAYVSSQNPFEFQVISAKDITNIRSSYIKGPLGGTSYVYFEFFYNKKRTRIPTFTSNQAYSLNSAEVLTGISKADAYCEILQNAQNTSI